MKFKTEYLLNHFRRIQANGEIGEVVLRPDLSATAMTSDQAFFVDAPPFTDEPLWEDPVGVPDFDFLVKALAKRAQHRAVVDLELNDDGTRLWIDGKVAIFLSEPETVGTRVMREGDRKAVLESVDQHEGARVHRDAAKEFWDFRSLTGAMEIFWSVGPEGTKVDVGADTGQYAVTHFSEIRADPGYRLMWQANAHVAAFANVQDWEEARVILTGDDSLGAVREGGWTYVMSPLG